MSKMFWHPKTGVPTVYEDHETPPDGHLDTHPENPALSGRTASTSTRPAPAAAANVQLGGNDPLDKPLTRTEVIAALAQGEIQYDNKATAVALGELLRTKLLEALHDREVEGVDDMSTRRLLLEVEK